MSPAARASLSLAFALAGVVLYFVLAKDAGEPAAARLHPAPTDAGSAAAAPGGATLDDSLRIDGRARLIEEEGAEPAAELADATEQAPPEAPPPPAGCIEVVVRGGAGRARYVHVLATRSSWLPRDLERAGEGLLTLPFGAADSVRACALEPGRYLVGLELDPGDVRQQRVELAPGAGRRVVFVLGGALLWGFVYDANGVTVEGARVQVDGVSGEPGSNVAWTGYDGAYRAADLSPGLHWVGVHHDGRPYGPAEHMLQIPIQRGEDLRHDFGSPHGLSTWTGVLRNLAGDPVGGSLRLRAKLHLVRANDGDYRTAIAFLDGSFTVRLAPGTYAVKASPPGHRHRTSVLAALQIGPEDLVLDLTLPWARVSGQITRRGADPGFGLTEGFLPPVVAMHERGHDYPGAFREAPIAPDGSYAFDGVHPGEWLIVRAGEELALPVEVVVRPGELRVTASFSVP